MTSFGRYETVRELHRSGVTVLYSGRTEADPAAKFAIKVFQPAALLLDTEKAKIESDLFLNSAYVQQKTVSGGAQHWAPIHECGSTPDGAFYATDKYDRSLQQLIDVRIKLSAQTLHAIIQPITEGLVELKQAFKRPHGNLKATNILIAGEGDISQTTIVLSDPLPDKYVDSTHWNTDLQAIAELIYQLIVGRPIPALGGWQIPESKEWTSLGRQADDWRNLCNRLLNASIRPGTMTIEMLIEELARLKKIKPVLSTRRLLIAIGLVVVAGAAILIMKPEFIFPSKPANIRDWNQLLTEYMGWVKDLRSELGFPKGNERQKRWTNNPQLSIIVEKIEQASYPDYVRKEADIAEADLKKIETEEDIDDFKIRDNKTIDALMAIEIIRYFFEPKSDPNSYRFYNDPNSPVDRKEYRKWPLLVEIHDAANSLTRHGWQRSGTYLQNLVDDIKPDPNIAKNVDKILQLQPSLDDIKSHWTKIEDNQKTIEGTGEPILSKFRSYVNQEPASALDEASGANVNDVCKKLRNELREIEQLSSDLAKSIEDNWKKLEENQNIIKGTGNPTFAKFPDYIQSKLASADLDVLGSELERISSLADKITKFIEDNWRKLEENQKTVENSGDPILARFPGYIQSKLASADLDILDHELEQIRRLVDNLANSIENIWQKADKEAFLNEHRDDSEEILTDKTFTERLDTIKEYYYLVPDPRDELFDLVKRTSNNIEEAKGYNPEPAEDCAKDLEQVQPDIEAIREFRGIKKELDQINRKINDLQPAIVKINEIAISLIETPEEWFRRISEDSRIASSEVLNDKWIELRDKVLKGLTADELDKNKKLYQVLRKRVKDTKENLVKLDGELLRELPSQIGPKLKDKSWNRKLKEVYDQERKYTITTIVENIPLKDEIPEINDPLLEEFRQNKFSEFEKRRNDFSGILEGFNKIEDGLDGCYLLSDELPEVDGNIRSLWEKWRDTVTIREAKISEVLATLTERLARLEEIEESDDRQKLAGMALEDESPTEAVYAAWLKLGELAEPQWPAEQKDLEDERKIQGRLKKEFGEIEKINRKEELLTRVAEIAREREIVFKKASIERFRKAVEKNYSGDRILADIVRFVSTEIDSQKTLAELEALENLTQKLADFVSHEDWQKGKDKFRKDLFGEESYVHRSYEFITMNNVEATIQSWLEEVEQYRKLAEDPRNDPKYSWDTEITDISKMIDNELVRKQAPEDLRKLESLKSKFDETESRINYLRSLPAIKKHEEQINRCKDYWEELLAIKNKLKPDYCLRLDLDNERLVFAATTNLHLNFEPIDLDNKEPVALTAGWEQIRRAIEEKEQRWVDFFHTIDLSKAKNVGWPKYIRSKGDPSVILRFVPAGTGNREPFYAATHEITNAQYQLFLQSQARSWPDLFKWSFFLDKDSDNVYVQSNPFDYPHCGIKWDDKEGKFVLGQWDDDDKEERILRDKADPDAPVIWVTFEGAKSYAKWLGAQLPTASQHKYACKADADTAYPWGNDLRYAHVRSTAWKLAASKYNQEKDVYPDPHPPLPNRIKNSDKFRATDGRLDERQIVHEENRYKSAWPLATNTEPNPVSNAWGLYDMIGNVSEWCVDEDNAQSVICGGSCLDPRETINDESNYKAYTECNADSDVGFRVILPVGL